MIFPLKCQIARELVVYHLASPKYISDVDETPDFPDEDDDQYNFVRNPKPENFGDEPLGDVPPTGGLREPRSRDPATVINLTADPRNIRLVYTVLFVLTPSSFLENFRRDAYQLDGRLLNGVLMTSHDIESEFT